MENLDADYFARTGAYTKRYFRDVYPSIDPRSPALSQKGKVVIISGGGTGLGARGFAPAFAQAGARAVVLVGRRADKLKETAEGLRKEYPEVEFVEASASVTDESQVKGLFESVKAKYGKPDVLVNGAGYSSEFGTLTESDTDSWWQNFEVNVKGTFIVIKAFLQAVGSEHEATVLSVTSAAASTIFPGVSAYSIAKMSLNRLAEFSAAEYPNVVSVALDPGTVSTDMVPDAFKKFALDTPMLVGGSAVWLASPQAKFMNGRTFKAGWDADELLARKDEIAAGSIMKFVLDGKPKADGFVSERH